VNKKGSGDQCSIAKHEKIRVKVEGQTCLGRAQIRFAESSPCILK
jgi:hypothetical protein